MQWVINNKKLLSNKIEFKILIIWFNKFNFCYVDLNTSK